MSRWWALVAGVALVLAACSSDAEPASVSIPAGAIRVGADALSTDALAEVAELRPGDRLYRLPAGDGHSTLVRVRDGVAPLLFGTSCDVVSAVDLPTGWEGVCLEYTRHGRRILGTFPHGTTSQRVPPES